MRADPPYTLAYVTLAEGPTMMTNIVDADPAALAIGQPVRIVWRAAEDGTPVPCFTPVDQPTLRLRPFQTGLSSSAFRTFPVAMAGRIEGGQLGTEGGSDVY